MSCTRRAMCASQTSLTALTEPRMMTSRPLSDVAERTIGEGQPGSDIAVGCGCDGERAVLVDELVEAILAGCLLPLDERALFEQAARLVDAYWGSDTDVAEVRAAVYRLEDSGR